MPDSDNESFYSATSSFKNNNAYEKEFDSMSERDLFSDSEIDVSGDELNSASVDDAPPVLFPDTGRESPRLELRDGQTVQHFIANPDKIFRTPFRAPYLAQFAYLTSPSSIWVRLLHHITDKLELPTAGDLEPAVIEKRKYAMAPIKEDVLGRARILDFNEDRSMAYVYFIDHGDAGAVNVADLFALPETFIYHPWQTIPLKLHGVNPNNMKYWTAKEVRALKKTLSRFKYLWVEPIPLTVYPNDDGYHYPASIRGLTDAEYQDILKHGIPDSSKGDQIAQVYFAELNEPIVPWYEHIDGTNQKSYPLLDRNFFDKFPFKPMERDYMLMERVPPIPFWANNSFPQLRSGFGEKFIFDGNKLWTFVMNANENAHPNRFFGYRLDIENKDTTKPNDMSRFRRFINEAVALSDQLRTFYHNKDNLHPMPFEDVQDALNDGINVYAIVEQPHNDLLCRFHFQRVKILTCFGTDKDTFVYRVQMLDTGNIEHCMPSSVYHIHPSHLEVYPLSYCFYYTSLKPANTNETWISREIKHFNQEVLKPMKVYVVELVEDGEPLDLANPLEISTMTRVLTPLEKPVEQQMLDSGFAAVNVGENRFDLLSDLRFTGETRAQRFAENMSKHGRFG